MNKYLPLGDLKIYEYKYLPHPYPDPPDDGTWEGEGGYVSKPNHEVWMMASIPCLSLDFGPLAVVHPLTMSEINYAINKDNLKSGQ